MQFFWYNCFCDLRYLYDNALEFVFENNIRKAFFLPFVKEEAGT